jgi:hypothetical protein
VTTMEALTCDYGIHARPGAVITAVNPVLADAEIASHLWRTGTRLLVTTDGLVHQ